ncbi:MAG: BamA/TamA family outer membrane protein [Nitrospirota bacterium]|nr:BamA/TamA family outer membrane protein [Nitrospirota bacterium]
MKRSVFRYLLPLLLWLLAVPAVAEDTRVMRVDWGSSLPLPAERLAEVSGLAPGVVLDRSAVARAVRLLSELPEIRQVVISTAPESGGVAVTVMLVGVQFASEVRVEGTRALSAEVVLDASGLKVGSEVGPELLSRVATRVKQFYFEQGYLAAEADVAVADDTAVDAIRVPVVIRVTEGIRARVGSVRLPGLPGADADGIHWPKDLRLSTRLGRPLDSGRLDKDVEKVERYLLDAGYLSPRVGPYRLVRQGERVNVIIPVLVDGRVQVTVVGSHHLSRKKVLAEMDLSVRRQVDEPTLSEAGARLRKRLEEEGFRDARVTVTAEPDIADPHLNRVSVVIEEGRRHRIRDIHFEGNYTFRDRQLLELVKPGWRLIEEPARSRIIARRAAAIEGALRALGFPDAEVGYRFDGLPDHPHMLSVTYQISEGPRWWFADSLLTGTEGVDPVVTRSASVKAGELAALPYRRDRLRAARSDLRRVFAEAGYPDVQVDVRTENRDVWRGQITPRGTPLREVLVDTEFQVTPGPAVTIGAVVIEGRFRTRRKVIERELTFAEGGVYALSSLAETRRRLFRTAAFDQVRIGQLDPDDRDEVRDVRVFLMEGRPGAVEMGLGYGEGDGVRGLIDLSYRDMFRMGHRANLRFRTGRLRRSFSFGYLLPWIGDWRANLRTRVLFEREDLISYERETRAVEAGIRRELSDKVTATTTYRLERNRYPRLPPTPLPERRRINVGSILVSLVREARDNPFAPTRGNVLGVTYEQGAHILLSEVQFGKGTVQAAGYLPVGHHLVVAAKGQGGRVRQLFESTAVPVSERFFMGGHSTVRGYQLDSIGVPDDTLIAGEPIGGEVMVLGNLEFRWGSEQGWGTTLFADAGNVWSKGSAVGVNDMRVGVGVGINYATPVGPLRLDWGHKVDRRPGEDPYRFHFTLGHTF